MSEGKKKKRIGSGCPSTNPDAAVKIDGDVRYRKPAKYEATEVSRMILIGKSKEECLDLLLSRGHSLTASKAIITEANKKCRAMQERSVTQMVNANLQKVQVIIDKCMDEERYDIALKAMDMLNKLGNAYGDGNKVQILTKDEAIQINFG